MQDCFTVLEERLRTTELVFNMSGIIALPLKLDENNFECIIFFHYNDVIRATTFPTSTGKNFIWFREAIINMKNNAVLRQTSNYDERVWFFGFTQFCLKLFRILSLSWLNYRLWMYQLLNYFNVIHVVTNPK